MNLTVPKTTVPANGTFDHVYNMAGAKAGVPIVLAPTPDLDQSWGAVTWQPWIEDGATAAQNRLVVRISNPTNSPAVLNAQEFTASVLRS